MRSSQSCFSRSDCCSHFASSRQLSIRTILRGTRPDKLKRTTGPAQSARMSPRHCFQFIGLAAYLLPLLCLAAAWRRFRTRAVFTRPLTDYLGLVVLVIAASALLSISQMRPLFDSSVQPGGLLGTVVAQATGERTEHRRRDSSAGCDCCNRIVARNQFFVRSTLRNHRESDR